MKRKRRTAKELILEPPAFNTAFTYAYRDASNYKTSKTVILSDWIGDTDVWMPYVNAGDDDFFFPAQVGLEPLQTSFNEEGSMYEDDHPYHELWSVKKVAEPATIDISAPELLDRFQKAARDGWDEAAESRAAGLPEHNPQARAGLVRRRVKEFADEYMEEHDGADPNELALHIREFAEEELAANDLEGIAFFDYVIEPAVEAYGLQEFMEGE